MSAQSLPRYSHGLARVYAGDFREVLPNDKSLANEIRGRAALAFTDPPFNIGRDYVGYDDRLSESDYMTLIENICDYSHIALRPGGRFCIHIPDQVVPLVHLSMFQSRDRNGCEWDAADWIVWHYRFGQHQHGRYINSKCHCLTFIKPGGDPVWNPGSVEVESDRASEYNDPRTQSKSKGNAGMRVPLDVWGIPSDGKYWGRVQGNSTERRSVKNGAPVDHDNQLPEVYLARVIGGWTNPNDLVVDFCGGSGTTAVVANALGRRAVTFEKGLENAASIHDRLKKGAVRV